jgi:phospholipid/cholesterol/gamma-HCH transport system ATP-binding protein
LADKSPAVEIIDLCKSFDGGREFVLKGLNLTVARGKLTAIIGYSGTGKSVLLRHILGLVRPTTGQINVLGQNMSELDEDQITLFRCKFGVLFQYAALFDDMSALDNVIFPINEHRKELGKKSIIALATEKLESCGLEKKHHGKLPSELSGGMRKRVGLARALALEPEILVYDEPTTGLDPILSEMVDDLILSTHRSRPGLTSIMVSHDLSAAFRLSDHIVMLDKGKVLLQGTPAQFFVSNEPLVKRFIEKGFKKDEVP